MLTAGFLQPLSTKGIWSWLPNGDHNNNIVQSSFLIFFSTTYLSATHLTIKNILIDMKKLSKEEFKYN